MLTAQRKKVSGRPQLWDKGAVSLLCPNCQHAIVYRAVCESVEELGLTENAIGISGVGCNCADMASPIFDTVVCTAHGRAPDVATGIKRSLYNKPLVFTMQGDGDCIAIGAGSLINAALRSEKITVIMVNNSNYGTTGGQMAPTTLMDQVTATTPEGRDPWFGYPAHVPEMLATVRGVAFAARGALNTTANYLRAKGYIKKAFEMQMAGKGLTFVEVLAACPTNWHLSSVESLKFIEERLIPEYPPGVYKDVDAKAQEPRKVQLPNE